MRDLHVMPPLARLTGAQPTGPLPFPLQSPGVRLYAQARQGLCRSLPRLGLQPGDEVLVPSYHHGSEVEALLRAGLRCRFYEPSSDLQPDQELLESLLSSRTRALHLIHYLGFPQDALRWRRWCDDRGLLLVEDAAQSWLAARDERPVGAVGDLAFFCLYKSVGVPDGAAVLGGVPLPRAETRGASGVLELAKPLVRKALVRSGWSRTGAYDQQRDIAVPSSSRAAAQVTRPLLRLLGTDSVALRRRAAYRRLQSELGHLVPLPYADLPDGASPWAFPVAVADKGAALDQLARRGVHGVDLWRYPHPECGREGFPLAQRLRQHVVGLPVHQGLTGADLDRVAAAARGLRAAELVDR